MITIVKNYRIGLYKYSILIHYMVEKMRNYIYDNMTIMTLCYKLLPARQTLWNYLKSFSIEIIDLFFVLLLCFLEKTK